MVFHLVWRGRSNENPMVVRRDNRGWLLDGALDLDTVMRALGDDLPISTEDRQHYNTLGGLAMVALGRVPKTGDMFLRGLYRFEVVNMDRNRVCRVLVRRMSPRSRRPS